MLTNVILVCIRNESPVKPEIIIIDFEIGVINAINRVFNRVKMHGCFFFSFMSIDKATNTNILVLSKMYKDNEQI